MKRLFFIATALFCAVGFAVFPARDARAGATRVSAGVVVVDGTHREAGGVTMTGAAPAPALSISHRIGRFSLFGEGVSTLGPLGISGGSSSLQSVELSYLNFVLRYHLSRSMTVGVGETIYNQLSDYRFNFGTISPPPTFVYVLGSISRERTRTVGTRFELRDEFHRSKRTHLEALLAVNPRLTARWTNSGDLLYSNGTSAAVPTRFIIPESGSQIDASIENSVRERRYTLVYGLRYTNLTLFFTRYSTLADRNAFVIPFVGISRTFGH